MQARGAGQVVGQQGKQWLKCGGQGNGDGGLQRGGMGFSVLEKAMGRIEVFSKGVIGFCNLERAFWLHFGDWMGE